MSSSARAVGAIQREEPGRYDAVREHDSCGETAATLIGSLQKADLLHETEYVAGYMTRVIHLLRSCRSDVIEFPQTRLISGPAAYESPCIDASSFIDHYIVEVSPSRTIQIYVEVDFVSNHTTIALNNGSGRKLIDV